MQSLSPSHLQVDEIHLSLHVNSSSLQEGRGASVGFLHGVEDVISSDSVDDTDPAGSVDNVGSLG